MTASAYSDVLLGWERFYLHHFYQTYDFASLAIPGRPGDGWRLLLITEIPLEDLHGRCKELFPCWLWTGNNVRETVAWNERDAKNGPYAIWVKDNVEADEELRNLSANDIREKGITTETLAERLILELKPFTETGGYLDIKNVTLCAGSRDPSGVVPGVCWRDGEITILWSLPSYRSETLRSRQVSA
jgi:hypothetical protein